MLGLSAAGATIVVAGLFAPYAITEPGPVSAFQVGYERPMVGLAVTLFVSLCLVGRPSTRRLATAACIGLTIFAAHIAAIAFWDVPENLAVWRGLDASRGPAIPLVLIGHLVMSAAVFAEHRRPR